MENIMFQGYTLEKIKEDFFSDPSKTCELKKGEVLMEQGERNDRLYILLDGQMSAFSTDSRGKKYEVFLMSRNMFAGVYSFFSGTFISKTTIVANADCKLAYLEAEPFEDREDTEEMIRLFLPVILTDLNARMVTVRHMARDREAAVTQLLKAEKMATLGQLAAGLAHELNNAVGVLKSKSSWLGDRIEEFLSKEGDKNLVQAFEKGRSEGNQLSTREIRAVRRDIEKAFKIKPHLAKELARTGYTVKELKKFKRKFYEVDMYWDLGTAIHDMELASRHATAVVQSVKELGGRSADYKTSLDVSTSIKEALTLIQSLVRRVEVCSELEENMTVTGSSGELVQVWINLLKNAIESMINAGTKDPCLDIKAVRNKKEALVTVTDNGPGIPEDLLEKIFQPDVTTKKGGLSFGLGLGLPISQKIMENYGGDITVRSEHGKTEFTVRVPIDS